MERTAYRRLSQGLPVQCYKCRRFSERKSEKAQSQGDRAIYVQVSFVNAFAEMS